MLIDKNVINALNCEYVPLMTFWPSIHPINPQSTRRVEDASNFKLKVSNMIQCVWQNSHYAIMNE